MRVAILFFGCWLASLVCAHSRSFGGSTHADWLHCGDSQAAWRFSALDQINTTNVKSLVPALGFRHIESNILAECSLLCSDVLQIQADRLSGHYGSPKLL